MSTNEIVYSHNYRNCIFNLLYTNFLRVGFLIQLIIQKRKVLLSSLETSPEIIPNVISIETVIIRNAYNVHDELLNSSVPEHIKYV